MNSNFFENIMKFVKLVDSYGTVKLIKSGIMMVFFAYATYISLNPSAIFDKYIEYTERIHNESFNRRMEISGFIKENLGHMLEECGAMRCFVVELHNGHHNSAGLSFNYGSLTYEVDRDSVESIMEDYSDFTLERFPFVLHIWNHSSWHGSMEDMSKIDEKMSMRLMSNGVGYMYATSLYGSNGIIGYVGVTFSPDDKFDLNQVRRISNKYASKISILLNNTTCSTVKK